MNNWETVPSKKKNFKGKRKNKQNQSYSFNDERMTKNQIDSCKINGNINPELFSIVKFEDKNVAEVIDARITLSDIPHSLEYIKLCKKSKNNRTLNKRMHREMVNVCHIGQRKLLLTEIQHLSANLSSFDEKALVIYVGSSPSHKLYVLRKLFPNVTFILVDPNEACIFVDEKKSHYHYEENLVSYISWSNKLLYKDNDGLPRYINHFKEGEINKRDKLAQIPWEENDMINHITSTNYPFYVFEECMTNELAVSLNKLINHEKFKEEKILFWSDARTCFKNLFDFNFQENKKKYLGKCSCNLCDEDCGPRPTDLDMIANTAMMYGWLKTITQEFNGYFKAMLKFRTPYFNDNTKAYSEDIEQLNKVPKYLLKPLNDAVDLGEDYIENVRKSISVGKPSIRFFKGEIYMQAFAASKSTESRLWIDLDDIRSPLIEYFPKEYEERFFYYNMIERFCKKFKNPLANKALGFDHCGDCAIEASILSNYLKLRNNISDFAITNQNNENDIKRIKTFQSSLCIEKILKQIGKCSHPLNRGVHGFNY